MFYSNKVLKKITLMIIMKDNNITVALLNQVNSRSNLSTVPYNFRKDGPRSLDIGYMVDIISLVAIPRTDSTMM